MSSVTIETTTSADAELATRPPTSLEPHLPEPRLPEPTRASTRTSSESWPPATDPLITLGHFEREPTARQLLRPFWFVGALLMMLDGVTTYIALEFFSEHGAREGNPLAVWAIEHLGVAGMCAVKVLIGVAMMWRLAATADRGHRVEWLNRGLVLRRRPRWKVQRNAAWTLAFSLVLMGVVVGNNLRAILSLWSR